MKQTQINSITAADKRRLDYMLYNSEALTNGQRIAGFDSLTAVADGDTPDRFGELIEKMYAKSTVGDKDRRLAMLHMTREELLAIGDPFIELAAALSAENEAMEVDDKRFDGALHRLRGRDMEAMFAWRGTELCPDAEGTKRLKLGQGEGYRRVDAVRLD